MIDTSKELTKETLTKEDNADIELMKIALLQKILVELQKLNTK